MKPARSRAKSYWLTTRDDHPGRPLKKDIEVVGCGASGRNEGFNMTLFGPTLGVTAIRFGRKKANAAHHDDNVRGHALG